MTDPYEVLGLAPDSDDDSIRRRYLEMVKEFSPERNPEKFTAIRQAYEALKSLDVRLKHRLFETGINRDSIEAIADELNRKAGRKRLSLQSLVSAVS